MQRTDIELEAERLINLHQTLRETAQVVYDITEKLIDSLPDETRNPVADNYVNFAYDKLMRADKIIDMERMLLSLKAYPSYSLDRNSMDIFNSRDAMFSYLDINYKSRELSNNQIRALDGVIESSIDFVESIAWVVRRSTQIVP